MQKQQSMEKMAESGNFPSKGGQLSPMLTKRKFHSNKSYDDIFV